MHKAKKILFIANSLGDPHGSSQSALDVINSLRGQYSIYLITKTFPYVNPFVAKTYNAFFFSCCLERTKVGWIFGRFKLFRLISILDLLFLRLQLLGSSFDLVIVNGYESMPCWLSFKKCFSNKYKTCVISRESPRHFSQGDIDISLDSQQKFLLDFDHIIFVSSILKAEWSSSLKLRNACYYLPNCCNEDRFLSIANALDRNLEMRCNLRIDDKCFLIINIGGVERRKGQDDLFELAARLHHKYSVNFKIVCVGPINTDYGATFKSNVLSSIVGSRFIFTGALNDVSVWFRAADLLIFTSRAEAMPRTILEGMASGIPIISSNVDGIPELIQHGVSGYMYTPGDIDELEKFAFSLMTNSVVSKSFASKARNRYLDIFSRANHRARLHGIVDDMLS
ncbi:putative alpha-galactosyltransferase [Synechococcus sp. RS9907]|uniref:glycosyltransferase family 4 protein n=1 Tax=Synechococcus sp. RS9907 TaxID=221350 RepID=UPI00165E2719|nr:glycosyltransferase family 4 protein [Synechococcus sp. RS9907]QNI83324.1 putative alpha-galactosyltransferase [Synechococcus sp. RS9907]